MWRILVFVGLCLTGFFVYSQHPESWRVHAVYKWIIRAVHLVGSITVFMMIFCFPSMTDGTLKSGILFSETMYFMMVCLMTVLCGIRWGVLRFAKWKNRIWAEKIKLHHTSFLMVCLAFSLAIAVIGYVRIDQIQSTSFDIDLTHGETEKGSFRAAVIADTHVGAGAGHDALDQTADNINRMNADVVFFVGDASDSCSSVEDLDYLCETLKKIKSRWGIYYISGNHDKETEQDVTVWLKDAGVILMENRVCTLPNGVILVGHADGTEITLTQILAEYEISQNETVICLQHRPQKLAQIQNDCDLVISGHTHGPRYPWAVLTQSFQFDNPEGIKYFGNMVSFTTTGVSAWGFHFKWPSHSETALLNIRY